MRFRSKSQKQTIYTYMAFEAHYFILILYTWIRTKTANSISFSSLSIVYSHGMGTYKLPIASYIHICQCAELMTINESEVSDKRCTHQNKVVIGTYPMFTRSIFGGINFKCSDGVIDLWTSDAICRHISGPTLAEVTACYPDVPQVIT